MGTREQILTAARKAFDRKGLEGLSLRDVAKTVGITPMAIYRHFENKDALVDALVLDGLARWSARVVALPATGNTVERLSAFGDAFLDFALKEPRRFEAAFLLRSLKARRYPDDFVAGQSPAGAAQLKIIEDAKARGQFAGVPAVEILIIIAGLSQGLVTLYRAGRIAGGEAEFRTLFRSAMWRTLESFRTEKRK